MTATGKYQMGTYTGTILVNCAPDEDNDSIIAKAKRMLRQRVGYFPTGIYYESWEVTINRGFFEIFAEDCPY